MPDHVKLKIVQIVVEVADGEYCAVSLPQDRKDLLIGFIADLSDGTIKLVRLPGVKMVPVKELENDHA